MMETYPLAWSRFRARYSGARIGTGTKAIFTESKNSSVNVTQNSEQSIVSYQAAIDHLLGSLEPSVDWLIAPGTRVFVKPYLVHGRTAGANPGMVTHPNLLRAVIEALVRRDARVSFGGGGLRFLEDVRNGGFAWVRDIARDTGADLVAFADAGTRWVPSRLLFPRRYLIAEPLLKADVIVSCANLQPHSTLIYSGSLKNMFNAVVGEQQGRLTSMYQTTNGLGRVVADVCRVVRPHVSLLDLTTVLAWDGSGAIHSLPVGRLLASYDPVALDTIAVDIVGLGATLTTSSHGDRLGVGIARRERITIRPRLDQVHASGRQIGFPAATPTTTGRVEQLIRLASHSLMAGRPWIDPVACTGCGVCTSACTPHAINRAGNGFVIDLERCTDCGYCQRVCDQNAISLRPRHPAIRLLTRTWKRAKCGARVPLGPVALSVRLERTPRKSQPHRLRRHLSQAEDGAPTAGRAVSTNRKVAVVVGVGAKLGSALVRRFANDDFDVIAVARGSNLIDRLADELHDRGQTCLPVTCDATYWRDVDTLFEIVERFGGAPDIVVYNIEEFSPGRITSIEPAAFENCWRFNCLGGFLVGRKAARSMLAARHGTILFSGATGAWRGRAGYINLAVGKFGLRALSQSMARELGPKGIHVAHIVLDSGMLRLDPTAVADAYLNLHRQPPTAWTQEIDLRPFNERW